jgi:cysteinyl-tRNA synthetase
MSNLKIYNTLARDKQVFVPIQAGKINMYVCGMTVYDYCHVGHARMMMAFDVIYRWLKASGYEVKYVRNITDIDDKIIKRAVENGETISQLTTRFIKAMDEDTAALGILPPDPGAARHRICAAHAGDDREAGREGPGLPGRGRRRQLRRAQVSRLRQAVRQVARRPARRRARRRQHRQARPARLRAVESRPRNPSRTRSSGIRSGASGRPGWHIECSAMSCALLGEHFDIHGGGADLQFPHHENEIAQSEGAFGRQMANYWIHNGFVRVDNEKMSKSLGNFFTIRDVLKKYDAEVVRFFILRAHYRSPLNYSDAHLDDAKGALTRLYTALADVDLGSEPVSVDWNEAHAVRFREAMDDDFNTPLAVAVLFDLVRAQQEQIARAGCAPAQGLAGVLGLLERTPQQFLQAGSGRRR